LGFYLDHHSDSGDGATPTFPPLAKQGQLHAARAGMPDPGSDADPRASGRVRHGKEFVLVDEKSTLEEVFGE
jgi:hypothetical protein